MINSLTADECSNLVRILAHIDENNAPPYLFQHVGELESKLARMACSLRHQENAAAEAEMAKEIVDTLNPWCIIEVSTNNL